MKYVYEIEVIYFLDFEGVVQNERYKMTASDKDTLIKSVKESLLISLSNKYTKIYNIQNKMLSREFIKKHLVIVCFNEYENDFTDFINEFHD